VRNLYAEAATLSDDDARKSFVRWATSCESKKSLDAMLNLLTHEDGIPIIPDEMDRDPWTLNVENGTLDLRSGKLRPHDPGDLLTKLCPVPYHPDAECPTFETFLQRIFEGRDDLIRFVQALCGYVLTGTVGEQVLPILHGIGANGKSTLVTALLDLLGPDYAMKAPADLLMVRRSEAHPTELADLFGKRLVVASETGEGCRLNETLVKELTGSERIRARRMRQDFWEFTPTHKVMLCTNHKPSIRGTDHAIWRRIRLIPFTVVIPDEEQDRNLDSKLRAELPGILAWCVRGCLAWNRGGLRPPAEVTEATSEYRSEEDILRAFLDEHCILGRQFKARAADLYGRYKGWAESSGENPLSQTRFGKALAERGLEKQRSNGIHYQGIGLRHSNE
jgi:putative DNA primase/helicase